ncbi:MAG: cytochrome-c peroxidase, partial [Bacteroidetes bacterium]|nr:cytochrome-c peroxidase [Bacteroidota bacterium]
MKKLVISTFTIALSITIFYSCQKEQTKPAEKVPMLPSQTYDYANFSGTPEHLRDFGSVTNEGATLGRVLFYDKQLSYNNQVACASCHLQNKGFSDEVAFSKGFSGQLTTRNAMTIANLGLSSTFFWDCRSNSLEEMVLLPIQNHIEMGFENLSVLEAKLNTIQYYKKLFNKVFGKTRIDRNDIASALAQYVRSIKTVNSKFDQGFATSFANFTAEEQNGMKLFNSERLNCNSCHLNTSFQSSYNGPAGNGFANNGLDMVYGDKGVEQGRMTISNGEGFFKVPNLRNIELTAPYMHDGRFKNLEEVVEHYNSGINQNKDLDHNLIDQSTGKAKRMNLTASEKSD